LNLDIIYKKPNELVPSPFIARKHKARKDIDVLVDSIREVGVLSPLLINDKNIIIDGRRRWNAGSIIKGQYNSDFELPCIVYPIIKPNQEAILSLIANYTFLELEEKDLERQVFLLTNLGWKLKDISKNIGISESILEMIRDKVENRIDKISDIQKKRLIKKKSLLEHSKRKLVNKLERIYKKDLVKQTQILDYFKKISLAEANEQTSQLRKKLPVNIKRQERRLEKNIPTVIHLIKYRKDIDTDVSKRLYKEKYHDLMFLVERLLDLWSHHQFCEE